MHWIQASTFARIGGGQIQDLQIDPGEWEWNLDGAHSKFFSYSTKKAYSSLNKATDLTTKWNSKWGLESFLDENWDLIWGLVWEKMKPAKLSAFLWQIANRVLKVGQFLNFQVALLCTCCNTGTMETMEHCLLSCQGLALIWPYIAFFYSGWGLIPTGRVELLLNKQSKSIACSCLVLGERGHHLLLLGT